MSHHTPPRRSAGLGDRVGQDDRFRIPRTAYRRDLRRRFRLPRRHGRSGRILASRIERRQSSQLSGGAIQGIKSVMADIAPRWTQDQAIAYEAACEAVNDVIAGYSADIAAEQAKPAPDRHRIDRKSTRLNSSH